MKKIIGILGVAVIAATMFFNGNIDSKSDLSLESLIGLNNANAEFVQQHATSRLIPGEQTIYFCSDNGAIYQCDGSSGYAYSETSFTMIQSCEYLLFSQCGQ